MPSTPRHRGSNHRAARVVAPALLALAALLPGCTKEPVADGHPMSYWVHEAGKSAVTPWMNGTDDDDRKQANAALIRIGEPAVPALVNLFKSPNPTVSGDAFNSLCALGPKAHDAIPLATKMLRDPTIEMRVRGALLLGRIGTDAVSSVKALGVALKDDDPGVRRAAAKALGEMGDAGRHVLERNAGAGTPAEGAAPAEAPPVEVVPVSTP